MPPISRTSAPHYIWGAVCDGWHLIRTPELSIIEERMPSGACERRHFHTYARQFFYVLTGLLTLELEDVAYTLHPGEGLEVPAGLLHQAFNKSAEDTRFLVTSQPASHGDRTDA